MLGSLALTLGAGAWLWGVWVVASGADGIPTVTGFLTVTWAWAAEVSTPTRPTAAVPMAAIDSATASQPTASPATW